MTMKARIRNRIAQVSALIALATVAVTATARIASAAEARPWLCRDKPVFSSNQSMRWSATTKRGLRWQLIFMQYRQGGAHDGFEIAQTEMLPSGSGASGQVPAGRYFAVAMHQKSGVWVCPANGSDTGSARPGETARLCFGPDESSCDVSLVIVPDKSAARSASSP
ncbi:MAG TPA: hypothetical protein VEF03_10510 [Candidatus Binataceae bacterium]|nr:hypothetical protein [Candidatus Binataceae bacterium]